MKDRFSLNYIFKNKMNTVFLASVFAVLTVISLITTIIFNPFNISLDKKTPVRTPNRGNFTGEYAIVNMGAEPIKLNSLKAADSASKNILRHIVEGLVRLDENGAPVPGVAESWEISEDGLIWTFKLRDNSLWPDGSKVTANDFVYAFSQLLKGEGHAEYAEQMKIFKNAKSFLNNEANISEVGFKTVNDDILILTLEQPVNDLLTMLADTQFAPVNQGFYEKNIDKYGVEPDIIYFNGPWYAREWVHGERIVLVKNDYYWNSGAIKIDQLLFISSGTVKSKIENLQVGNYDFIYVPTQNIEEFSNAGFKIDNYNDGSVVYLEFNTQDPVMSNVHLRKALAYSIDRESFVAKTLNNGSEPSVSLVNPSAFLSDLGDFDIKNSYFSIFGSLAESISAAKSELELAKKELSKEQLKSIKITVDDSQDSKSKDYANALALMWKQHLGLDVAVEALPYSSRVTMIQNNAHQILINAWDAMYPDLNSVLDLFANRENNFTNYNNADFYNKLSEIAEETDRDKRNELFAEAFSFLKNDVPVAPLYAKHKSFISTGRVKNIIADAYRDIDMYYAYTEKSTQTPAQTPDQTPAPATEG